MTAKEYLSQLQLLNIKINQKIKEAEELRAMAFNAGALGTGGERVQTSPSGTSKQQDAVEKYVDMQAEINAQIDEFADMKHRIIDEIQQLEDSRYVELLDRRYVHGEKFEQIAVNMHYGYEWICRLHGLALLEFERKVMKSHNKSY